MRNASSGSVLRVKRILLWHLVPRENVLNTEYTHVKGEKANGEIKYRYKP
jgi:hypothetical protein